MRFVRQNRKPLAVGVVLLAVGALLFQYVIGLNVAVAVVLFLITVGVALAIYRRLNRTPIVWDQPLGGPRLAVAWLAGLVVVTLAIQAVPFGRDHSNPPVTGEPEWDSPRTRELMVRACFDCHSNEVAYPWYSNIAPMSWAVQLHVDEGREKVNYSEWNLPQKDADESVETVVDGEMPPGYYTLLTHSAARLSDTERSELIQGLKATLGTSEDDDD